MTLNFTSDPEFDHESQNWPQKSIPQVKNTRKTCIARDCKFSRKVIFPPPSAAAILDLCKLAEFPKFATPATEPDFLHRTMRVRNHQKTIHFSQQQGTQPGNWTIWNVSTYANNLPGCTSYELKNILLKQWCRFILQIY